MAPPNRMRTHTVSGRPKRLVCAPTAKYSMACTCASAIDAEMEDWIALGGQNSGCCGNAAHTYGFHCPANRVPTSDYSRRRDPGRPVNMNWACAGDFSHQYKPALMAKHAALLTRLMRGELPMIAEFIGKPWPGKPVYYWARWNGSALQRYTGAGHDHWSHVSWFRSRADQRAHLWTSSTGGQGGSASITGTSAPKFPGYSLKRNDTKPDANVRTFQNQARSRGAKMTADGLFGPGTATFVKAFQSANRLTADAIIGPATWAAIFNPKTVMP